MAIDVVGLGQLGELLRLPGDDAGVVHHLGHTQHSGVAKELADLACRDCLPG